MHNEMLLSDWYPCLVTALEAEELDNRRAYMGSSEDYIPFFAPEQSPTELERRYPGQAQVATKVLRFAQATNAMPLKGTLEQASKLRPDRARKVMVDDQGNIFDENGTRIEAPPDRLLVDAEGKPIAGQPALSRRESGSLKGLNAMLQLFGLPAERETE